VEIGIALHPALALDYGAAHIVLTCAGYPDATFEDSLAMSLAASTAHARERLPHRELEQDWLASLRGGPEPSPETLGRTALVRGIDLLTGSRDDVYALTHAVLYASDFGNRSVDLADADGSQAVDMARSALAWALDDDDFDLAGELLLTWPFLGADWDETASLAFAILAQVEDEVGVLPSLALDREAYERQSESSRKSYVAAAAYHTAYVMGLLCAAMLTRDSRAEVLADGPGPTGALVCADSLLARLVASNRRPQWLRYVEAAPRQAHGAATALLLDAAVRRAIRQLELGVVRDLLELAVDHGYARSPLCLQAAGLLRRVATLASPKALRDASGSAMAGGAEGVVSQFMAVGE
jgi:hypothetical protein